MTTSFQSLFAGVFLTLAASLFCCEGILQAQDEDRRRGRGGRDRGLEVMRYLDRADRDDNGVLDNTELGGRIRDYVRDLGIDTSRPVPISKIKRAYEAKKQSEADAERRKTIDANRQVEKFGTGESLPPPPDFAVNGSAGSKGRLEDQYPEETVTTVTAFIDRYDENKDGLLDNNESSRVRRMIGDDADTDNNGKIDKFELAAGLAKRANPNNDRGRGDRGRGDRGRGDRGRGDRGDRGGRGDRGDRGDRGSRFSRDRSENRPQPPSEGNPRDIRGNRSSNSSPSTPSSSSGSSNRPSRSLNARYSSYVDGIIKRYDKDGDRKLSDDERKEISGTVKNKLVDENGDGFVDRQELINSVAGRAQAATPDAEPKRESPPSERRRRGDRDRDDEEKSEDQEERIAERSRSRGQSSDIRYDVKGFGNVQIKTETRTDKKTDLERRADRKFLSFDKNTDGQITMGEFRDGKQWTDQLVRKFQKLDGDANGIVTVEEFDENYNSRDFDD